MPKEEASSPVVATESLLLSGAIDSKNCNIITLDVLNTFLQCDTSESIDGEQMTLKIHRALADMLCKIALEVYKDFVTYHNSNNKILHASILKPLCRMLKALILHY